MVTNGRELVRMRAMVGAGGGGGGDTTIEDGLITGTLTEYTNNRVESVRDYAFYNNTTTKEINLPNVKTVGAYSFYNCSALTKINAPNVVSAGMRAFANSGITSVHMPLINPTAQGVFRSCRKLETAFVPKITDVPQECFYECTALGSFDFSNVVSVGKQAFQSAGLTSVDAPKLTTIGYSAFSTCSKIEMVNFPVATSIGQSAFSSTTFKNATFPEVLTVGNSAFSSSQVEWLDFPKATQVGQYCFMMTNKLKAVFLRSETMCVASGSPQFSNNTIPTYIYTPSALIEEYKVATNWSLYADYFRALEDYTVDGTTTGEIDWDKIEGVTE